MADEENDDRLAAEVAHLSTKLMTEVTKLLQLEEIVLQLRKENHTIKQQLVRLQPLETAQQEWTSRRQELELELKVTGEAKETAEAKNKQLEGEVEDLTASLFDEANKMVSNASRETHNYKVKNGKLQEELEEKNIIIENLQDQLRDLKGLFMRMEDQQRSTPKLEGEEFLATPDEEAVFLNQLMYSPRARAVRFDLQGYQLEFKGFIYQLINPGFAFDLASLKNLKYFRKIWVEEIEPSFPVIPAVTTNFMNRWSKGKTFWGLLVEGRAIIEPVSGVNETFKLTYKGAKSNETPVAMKDPCAFCGEAKDDMLEHARLYNLKLYGPATETGVSGSTTEIAGELHVMLATYPLCNFCLVKLRAICEFFAKLRLIHGNIHKLSQNRLYDDIALVSNIFKRAEERVSRKTDLEDEPVLVKLYMMLLMVRARIFWSKTGFWDTEEDVECVMLDDTHMDVFQHIVRDNVAFQGHKLEVKTNNEVAENGEAEETADADMSTLDAAEDMQTDNNEETVDHKRASTEPAESDEEFADTIESFDQPLTRRKSKSKQFKEKMDRDLDNTMQMLKESFEKETTPVENTTS